ncbi:hypothetical protein Pmani_015926 [Petrolisthes manimaculis]|uniref:Uncharacterized protein n=1 Tax=Petrolisthes manimaculis TaxID=1843537 RepID=A0AAE1U6Y7_9EUCA|nr:hypothetical protein Pmani_015926 [Petrolisthes manimaculis]
MWDFSPHPTPRLILSHPILFLNSSSFTSPRLTIHPILSPHHMPPLISSYTIPHSLSPHTLRPSHPSAHLPPHPILSPHAILSPHLTLSPHHLTMPSLSATSVISHRRVHPNKKT